MAQTPRIVYSPLGNRWYVVTRFREKAGINPSSGEPTRYMVASIKYDVTDQIDAVVQEYRRVKRRKK
jgi:hypothetical protein